MREGAELLAFGAFLHVLAAVSLDGRPIVARSKDLSSHRSCPRMVTEHRLMYLDKDILSLLIGDPLDQGGRVALLV